MQADLLDVRSTSSLFRALGDETRLRIVALLAHGELCVCHIEAALKLSQPTASRHLGVLKGAGVVEGRRRGTWVHYRLAEQREPQRRRYVRFIVRQFADQRALARDVARVQETRGPAACR